MSDAAKPSRADIDPELVNLRRRFPAGPVLVASVLGFALLLMVRLRHDFAFAGQPEQPADLGRIAGQATPLPDNAHVSLVGEVDARAPARLRGHQDTGYRLAPVLGTAGRVWIHEPGEAIDVAPGYDGRFAGRLRRLDETPFAGELRARVAALPPQPRTVFAAALAAGGLPDVDVHGEPLHVTPDARVAVSERVADACRVTIARTESIVSEPTARRALEAAGFTGLKAIDKSDSGYTYEAAGDAAAATTRLRDARLFSADATPKLVAHEGTAGALRITADAVTLGATAIPRAAVTHITVYTPSTIPDDASVLQSGDTPARLWYMRPLYGVFALIALLMVWALVVDLRHVREPRADPPV